MQKIYKKNYDRKHQKEIIEALKNDPGTLRIVGVDGMARDIEDFE